MAEEFANASFDLDYDAFTGTSQRMHFHDNKITLETTANIDALAEQNKEIRNDVSRTSRSGDMVKVASLPMLTYLDLQARGVLRDKAEMRKWLQSEEAAPFRTSWMTS